MSTKPPVPSKNALRALRRLAFSSSTLLGAVGGVCGLATINYEARRRVKVVEQIVATKKTLRSVSNGRGRAHITRMCEAAERGEDFTLDMNKESKRKRVRHQSTSAFDEWSGRESEIHALQESIQMLYRRPGSQISDLQHSNRATLIATSCIPQDPVADRRSPWSRFSNLPPLEYRQILPEKPKKAEPDHGMPKARSTLEPRAQLVRRQSNSRSANRILAATQVPLKRESHGVYARQTRQYVTQSPRHDASATVLRPAQAQAQASVMEEEEEEKPGPYEDIAVEVGLEQQLLRGNPHTPAYWIHADYEAKSTETHGDAVAAQAKQSDGSDEEVGTREISPTTSDGSLQNSGIFAFPASEDGFEQWPGLAESKIDESVDKDDVDLHDSDDDVAVVGNEFGHTVQDDLYGLFTRTYNESNHSSRRKSGAGHRHGHLQAVEHNDRAEGNYSSLGTNLSSGVAETFWEQATVPRILEHANYRLQMFVRNGGVLDTTHCAEAMEELDMLLGQSDPKALALSLEAIRRGNSKAAVFNAMTRCLDLATSSSIAEAELLFYGFFKELFPAGKCMEENIPCRRLAAHLLRKDPTSKRAAYMLFPLTFTQVENRLYKTAHDYLYWFCQSTTNAEGWIEETWKVVALAQQRGVPLHERIIVPALKELTLANKRKLAQKLVDDMQSKTDMYFRYLSYNILIRSHAADGDWRRVQNMLSKLHEQGMSRSRPIGFSRLFDQVLRQYLRQKSLDQAYDYTIHATATVGLIPTSTISCTIITASLQQERYDLIQDWVEMLRQLFPFVDPGTGTAMSAWRFGHVWNDRKSSCEEIEAGCQAMAYGAIRDPFSTPFRDLALHAVEQDLRRRISISNDLWRYPSPAELEESVAKMYLTDMAKLVQGFIEKHPNPATLSLRQREHLQDILRQIRATTRLNRLFSGRYPDITDISHEEALLHAKVRGSNFPSRSELWAMISNVYIGRQRRGQKPAHDVLEFLVPRMTQVYMSVDAYYMLNSMYESPYAQGSNGTPFSHDLFELWLHVAIDAKYGMGIAKVLWAIVDSGIAVDPHLLLLIKIAYIKRATNRRLKNEDREQYLEEGEYLFAKLKRKLRNRNGPGGESTKVMFAEFMTWEDRMRLKLAKVGVT